MATNYNVHIHMYIQLLLLVNHQSTSSHSKSSSLLHFLFFSICIYIPCLVIDGYTQSSQSFSCQIIYHLDRAQNIYFSHILLSLDQVDLFLFPSHLTSGGSLYQPVCLPMLLLATFWSSLHLIIIGQSTPRAALPT